MPEDTKSNSSSSILKNQKIRNRIKAVRSWTRAFSSQQRHSSRIVGKIISSGSNSSSGSSNNKINNARKSLSLATIRARHPSPSPIHFLSAKQVSLFCITWTSKRECNDRDQTKSKSSPALSNYVKTCELCPDSSLTTSLNPMQKRRSATASSLHVRRTRPKGPNPTFQA